MPAGVSKSLTVSDRSEAIEIHHWPETTPGALGRYYRTAAKRLLGYDPVLLRLLERQRIDLLSHNGLGTQRSINTLPWQPDFQHKVFPQFFSPQECADRDAGVARAGRQGNILLSSYAAANDFRRYYPELAAVQTHILHLSGTAVLDTVPLTREELEAQYPGREPYFFLPNQFWQHKNHGVVVEALRQTPTQIRVICTGPMQDYRDPRYVPSLLEKVKQSGLEQRFVCLGTVAYPTLVSLMHHSLAVLQPSLFEGWSTSVEESKAMCKQIILSNIAVHMEQHPARGVYFSPDSPEELAACLTRVYSEFSPVTERSFAEQRLDLRATLERGWIEDYARILKRVSGSHAKA